MKTAISLSDDLFEKVERLVRRSGRSRSELYAAALREYVARHSEEEITAAYNEVLRQIDPDEDRVFIDAAAREVLKNIEWQ